MERPTLSAPSHGLEHVFRPDVIGARPPGSPRVARDHGALGLPVTSTWAWIGFSVLVLGMLALDLMVFHRRAHAVRMREALIGSGIWVGVALAFNVGIYLLRGPQPALEFLTAYLIELSLSVDNLFVFLLLFSYFRVPSEYRHRVLFWGIFGAIVMRLAFIFAGVSLIQQVHWIIYVFGAILVWSGIKMATQRDTKIEPEKSVVLRLFRRVMPVSDAYTGAKFFVRVEGRRTATLLFVVLLLVETTDLVFAVDSIPAVLAISTDPFIVYTSNVFAILGLRAMFFALAGLIELFHVLHYGLAAILVFVGVKMLLSDVIHIPIHIALGVVGSILVGCVLLSLALPRRAHSVQPPADPTGPTPP